MSEITAWLTQANGDDATVLDRVFEALYPELRRLARVRAEAGANAGAGRVGAAP